VSALKILTERSAKSPSITASYVGSRIRDVGVAAQILSARPLIAARQRYRFRALSSQWLSASISVGFFGQYSVPAGVIAGGLLVAAGVKRSYVKAFEIEFNLP
jgi:hypothetical protein